MAALQVHYYEGHRALFWREVHTALKARLNLMIYSGNEERAEYIIRSIRRYNKRHGIGGFVSRKADLAVVLFL